MHCIERHEEGLNGGVVCDAASSLRVALHAVDEDLDAAPEGIEKLFAVVRLAILELLMTDRYELNRLNMIGHFNLTASSQTAAV